MARQGGVALIVALVVLVIIGLTSAAVMRGALSSDLITNNTRVQSLATQAAQVALSYCEQQYRLGPTPPIIVLTAPAGGADMAWETFGNWSNVNMVNEVPADYMRSALSTFVPSTLPQCMVQHSTTGLPNNVPTLVITARGFSPDYAQTNGLTTAGSVVWLQYIMAI
jgi:type II secretory pathway pseudopilin PulG